MSDINSADSVGPGSLVMIEVDSATRSKETYRMFSWDIVSGMTRLSTGTLLALLTVGCRPPHAPAVGVPAGWVMVDRSELPIVFAVPSDMTVRDVTEKVNEGVKAKGYKTQFNHWLTATRGNPPTLMVHVMLMDKPILEDLKTHATNTLTAAKKDGHLTTPATPVELKTPLGPAFEIRGDGTFLGKPARTDYVMLQSGKQWVDVRVIGYGVDPVPVATSVATSIHAR